LCGLEAFSPDFMSFMLRNASQLPRNNKKLVQYFERHILLDSGEHGLLTMDILEEFCKDSQEKWAEAERTSAKSVELFNNFLEGLLKIGSTRSYLR
jgi:hypothetical protein